MTTETPCKTCGGRVRLERVRDESLAGGEEPTYQRRCSNPACDTNTGEASAADEV